MLQHILYSEETCMCAAISWPGPRKVRTMSGTTTNEKETHGFMFIQPFAGFPFIPSLPSSLLFLFLPPLPLSLLLPSSSSPYPIFTFINSNPPRTKGWESTRGDGSISRERHFHMLLSAKRQRRIQICLVALHSPINQLRVFVIHPCCINSYLLCKPF